MDVREFLGLRATHNPHRWYLPVEQGISTRGGFLFGGCALAAAVAALEATAGRALVWATAQYLDYARPPSFLDIDVIIPVAGRQTTQARALGHVGDREIITVNAALGDRDFDVVAQWEVPPEVPPPAECPPATAWQDSAGTLNSRFEIRVASGRYGAERDGTPSHDGRSALWIRVPSGIEMSAGMLAIIADWMPSGIGQALGRWAGGNSLDNTIRILSLVPTEWVLCDTRIHGIRRGYGHGVIHLWAEDGTLLATGSQSTIVRIHEAPR
jgi:acyl-CoA thioesterase